MLIRAHFQLADVFGSDNRFGLGSGPDADQADNVVIWDPVVQQEVVYYFHSTRMRWERKGVAEDASQAVLRFPHGLFIVRRTPGTLWLVLKGEIGSDSVLLPVKPGSNVLSLPINLSASLDQLFSNGNGHSVYSGPNANVADLITFEEPSTGQQRGPFYSQSLSGNISWREIGVNGSDDATQALDLLSTLVLQRRGVAGYVYAEGSLTPGPASETPPVPEPGMPVLTVELGPYSFPPGASAHVEVSTDLQNWIPQGDINVSRNGNMYSFPLPSGYPRGFYRLGISLQ